MDTIFAEKLAAKEKFEVEDVTPERRDFAEVWLTMYEGRFDFLIDLQMRARSYRLSNGQIKAVLNCMLQDMARNRVGTLEPGMYQVGEDIYKVQATRDARKNLYAKRLVVIGGNRLNDDSEAIEHFDFEYAPGAIKMLTAADRMDVDTAKAFGIRYGICCYCGKRLKDAKSVSLGIGPVCLKRV